jgi:eukaryotic-like serine/threonine-protein kinase
MNPPPSVAGFREGDILAGKYRIDKILGAGGMGMVVAAHHVQLDEKVAIKFLLPEMLDSGEAVARFAREARAAVKIKSEHVARVSDVGTLDNGAPYMVMEYLEGGDLAAWLKQRGTLPGEQAVEFVLQASEAIAEAHALGIVHRDLKPANLFVIRRPDGALSVKVLDFGISKMRGVGSSVPDISITKTSVMMGSPLYMSPEQMQSAKEVDSRTDIWALGVILYELISGHSPFWAESMPELVAKIISMPPPSLREMRPDVPEGLEAAILKCLRKSRNERFESVGELAHALAPFAPRRSRLSLDRITGVMRAAGLSGATALPPSSDPNDPEAPHPTQGAWGTTNAPAGRRTVTVALGALALLVGAGAVFVLQKPSTTPAAEPIATLDAGNATPMPPQTAPAPAQRPDPPPAATTPVPSIEVAEAPGAVSSQPKRTQPKQPPAVVPRQVAQTAPPPSPPREPVAPKPAAVAKPASGSAFDDRK